MKLRESLFCKLFGNVLFLLFIGTALAGTMGSLYMVDWEPYRTIEYVETNRCESLLTGNAYNVREYYSLLLRQKAGEKLLFNDSDRLEQLHKELGVSSPNNLVWELLDENGSMLLNNLQTTDTSLEETVSSPVSRIELQTEKTSGNPGQTIHVRFGLRKGLPYTDQYTKERDVFHIVKRWFPTVVILSITAGLLGLALLCFLIAAAGHKRGMTEIVMNTFDKVWWEFLALGVILLFALAVNMFVFLPLLCFAVDVVFLSFVRRAKAGAFYKTSFLYFILRFFVAALRHIPILLRLSAVFFSFLLLQILVLFAFQDNKILWLLMNLAMYALLVPLVMQYDKIKKATDRMAKGNLGSVIDEKSVPLFSRMAHNLNSTSVAIQTAVDLATKSERMKTELITNVSHDIKTPLTSIISYVGLLQQAQMTDPKAGEYLEILQKKSKRLAQLMEDLVEASMVTSGAIAVNMEALNVGELLNQASGEYQSRFEKRDIELVCQLPEMPMTVYADGRHMWRVLDNLFANALKYTLKDTRIYVNLFEADNEVLLSMKNISRDPLNIHPEELMERFVRGDDARQSEGSGLGLSIAQSLMELQGGALEIQIDGDLFKATIHMKKMTPLVTGS